MTRRRTIALGAGLAATGAMLRRRSTRVPTDPLDPDAIRAETAAARTAEIVGRPRVRRVDLAQTYAPAIATAVDPLLHGRRYFPRMLEDIAAATDHVHLLIYGYKAGDIGETFLAALADRVAAGVEVRLSVDAIGSEVDFGSKDLFRRLLAAGVEVVAQDGIAVIRTGDLGGPLVPATWRGPAPLRPSQDGRHRRPGRLRRWQRHRGPLQRRALLRRHVPGGGTDRRPAPVGLPAELASPRRAGPGGSRPGPVLPDRDVAGRSGRRLPGADDGPVERSGHRPSPDQRRDRDRPGRRRRADPHRQPVHLQPGHPRADPCGRAARGPGAADRSRKAHAALPGRRVPALVRAAARCRRRRSCSIPQMAHAKVLRIDDQVFIGGCNLDDLSLFRNDELDLLFADPAVAELTERSIFDELSGMSTPAVASTNPRARAWNATMDRVSRFL